MRYFLCLAMLLVAACGDDSTTPSGGTGAGGNGGTGSGGQPNIGGGECVSHTASAEPEFDATEGQLELRAGKGFATFEGSVLDAAPTGFHVESSRTGNCRLLTYSPTNCNPPCAGGAQCVNSVCVETPGVLDAGTLTLSGFLSSPAQIEPSGGIYYWSQSQLNNPGGRATLSSSGGEVGEFDLSVCVPTPPTPVGDWSQQLEARDAGEDVTLTWSDPLPGARVYLRMTTGIGTHGGISPVEIECEGPDTGSLVLPGDYLDALYAMGWSCGECGDNQLKRYFSDEAALTGATVRFRAEAWAGFWFRP